MAQQEQDSSRVAIAEKFLQHLLRGPSWDNTGLKGLRLERMEVGRIVCKITATPELSNRYGSMHGGCIATLVDSVSTVALLTVSPLTGVSVSIQTTYMSPVPIGEEVTVEAYPVKVGKTLATVQADILVAGRLCARGIHTKYLPIRDPVVHGNNDKSTEPGKLQRILNTSRL